MKEQSESRTTDLPSMDARRRVLIVGGVAGGASCAARLRRLDESVEISDVRSRSVRLVRELRSAVLRRQCDFR